MSFTASDAWSCLDPRSRHQGLVHYTMAWHGGMARWNNTVAWHGVMTRCNDTVAWHGGMTQFPGTVAWHGVINLWHDPVYDTVPCLCFLLLRVSHKDLIGTPRRQLRPSHNKDNSNGNSRGLGSFARLHGTPPTHGVGRNWYWPEFTSLSL